MKLLKFVMYIFYTFHTRRRLNTPYFRTMVSLMMLLWLHYLQLIILFAHKSWFTLKKTDVTPKSFFIGWLFVIAIAIIIYFFIKPKDLQEADYDADKLWNGGVY